MWKPGFESDASALFSTTDVSIGDRPPPLGVDCRRASRSAAPLALDSVPRAKLRWQVGLYAWEMKLVLEEI